MCLQDLEQQVSLEIQSFKNEFSTPDHPNITKFFSFIDNNIYVDNNNNIIVDENDLFVINHILPTYLNYLKYRFLYKKSKVCSYSYCVRRIFMSNVTDMFYFKNNKIK